MCHQTVITKYGGNVVKDMSGRQEYKIEIKVAVALFAEKTVANDGDCVANDLVLYVKVFEYIVETQQVFRRRFNVTSVECIIERKGKRN